MVVVIDSSAPGRVARFRPAWRKCMTMARRPTSTIGLIGLQATNTIGYYAFLTSLLLQIKARSIAKHRLFCPSASAPSKARLCQSGAGPDPGSPGRAPGTACCVGGGNVYGEAYTGR